MCPLLPAALCRLQAATCSRTLVCLPVSGGACSQVWSWVLPGKWQPLKKRRPLPPHGSRKVSLCLPRLVTCTHVFKHQ